MKQQLPTLGSITEQSISNARRQAGATTGMAIALSGGLDSSALLHLAHAYARQHGVILHAFHIHHGLSPNADAWLSHCEQACASLVVPFAARRVQLERKDKTGTEEAARKSRYAALGALCREHGISLLLTAHHQDDQAETVLLQLLRGAGPAGLSGMDAANTAAGLLGNDALVMARPLLTVSRKQLAAFVAEQGIRYVDDESNDDPRFARNALRHQVMPALATAFPGFQERFARSAAHAQSAQRLLTELAEQDLALCLQTPSPDSDTPAIPVGGRTPYGVRPRAEVRGEASINLTTLRTLSQDRIYNLLRHWFATRGLRMPSAAWLSEMVIQLFEARYDAQLLVTHPDCHVRRYRDHLYLTPKLPELEGTREDQFDQRPGTAFTWQGEAQLAFPAYGGVLHFEQAAQGEQGIAADWLRAQPLVIEFRRGGERLKLAPNRSTRPLKYHYQELDIPAWERTRLPVLKAGRDLIFAAGIGLDCKHLGAGDGRIRLRWQAV